MEIKEERHTKRCVPWDARGSMVARVYASHPKAVKLLKPVFLCLYLLPHSFSIQFDTNAVVIYIL